MPSVATTAVLGNLNLIEEIRRNFAATIKDTVLIPTEADKLAGRHTKATFAAYDSLVATARELDKRLKQLVEQQATGRFTPVAITSDRKEIVDSAVVAFDTDINAMYDASEQLASGLRRLTSPPRPEPVDATQIALVAEMRSKWQHLLDSVDNRSLLDRLCTLLDSTSGDPLATWAIAGDDWSELYVESRGVDVTSWRQRRDARIAPLLPAGSARAAELQQELTTGRRTLAAVGLIARNWGRSVIQAARIGHAIVLPPDNLAVVRAAPRQLASPDSLRTVWIDANPRT